MFAVAAAPPVRPICSGAVEGAVIAAEGPLRPLLPPPQPARTNASTPHADAILKFAIFTVFARLIFRRTVCPDHPEPFWR